MNPFLLSKYDERRGERRMNENQLYLEEAIRWKMKFLRKPSMAERMSKGVQSKINARIPAKVHKAITESIKRWSRPLCSARI